MADETAWPFITPGGEVGRFKVLPPEGVAQLRVELDNAEYPGIQGLCPPLPGPRKGPDYLKFLPIVRQVAKLSKDRSRQVGCLVLDDDLSVRVSGYNGFPRGVDDDVDTRHARPAKYLYTSHAEENAVAQAARMGASLKGCTLLVTELFPCSTCSRLIIQSGIIRVIAPYPENPNSKWYGEAKVAIEMLEEAGVLIVYY